MSESSASGRELDQFRLPVEPGKVREFAKALLDENPLYQVESVAHDAGFDRIPAPLTFAAASMHYRDDLKVFEQLDLDLGRVLHGETTWEYLAPVNVGDELQASRRIVDNTKRPGRRGGDMTLVTFEIEFVNQHGETVLRERDVIIETGSAS